MAEILYLLLSSNLFCVIIWLVRTAKDKITIAIRTNERTHALNNGLKRKLYKECYTLHYTILGDFISGDSP